MIVGILDENSKKLDTENSCRSKNNEVELNVILETNYDCLVDCIKYNTQKICLTGRRKISFVFR